MMASGTDQRSVLQMRVWLIQPSEQLPSSSDVRKLRTRRLAEELSRRGHEVVWWASCFNHLRKQWHFTSDTTFEPIPGVTIHALKGIGYSRNVSIRRLIDHRLLARKFRDRAKRAPRPDIVVTSLPPHDLAAEAVRSAKQHGAKAVVDIRDKWPDNLIDVLPKVVHPWGRLILTSGFAKRDYALREADLLLSMTEPLLQWGLRIANRTRTVQDRVFYLGASSEMNSAPGTEVQKLVRDRLKGRFVIAFVGTFSTYHNPEAMIEAAHRLKHRDDLVWVLMGSGDLGQQLRKKAHDLPNVIFTGWLDSSEISTVLRHSHLGLCTSGKRSEKEFLPNKVFSYLAEGLPIGSTFDGELRELITTRCLGFNFTTSDQLADEILSLAGSPLRHGAIREAAQQFFKAHCEAGAIYRQYADTLEELSGDD